MHIVKEISSFEFTMNKLAKQLSSLLRIFTLSFKKAKFILVL